MTLQSRNVCPLRNLAVPDMEQSYWLSLMNETLEENLVYKNVLVYSQQQCKRTMNSYHLNREII